MGGWQPLNLDDEQLFVYRGGAAPFVIFKGCGFGPNNIHAVRMTKRDSTTTSRAMFVV